VLNLDIAPIPGFSDINKVPLALLVCSIKRSKYVSRPESCEKYISDNMEIDEELLFRDIKNGDCSPGVIAVHLLISHDPVKVAMQF